MMAHRTALPSVVKDLTIERAYEILTRTPPGERVGRHIRALCVAHADTKPSMDLAPDSDSWFCRSCSAGGGILDLPVAAKRASNRREAAELYEKLLGRTPHAFSRTAKAKPTFADIRTALQRAEGDYRQRHGIDPEGERLVAADVNAIRATVSARLGVALNPVRRGAADSFVGGRERDPLWPALLAHEWFCAWVEYDGEPPCCNVDGFSAHGPVGYMMLERAERAAAAQIKRIAAEYSAREMATC